MATWPERMRDSMKKWKTITCLLLSAGLVFGLAACGQNGADSGGGTEPSETPYDQPPEGFVDNEVDVGSYTEAELYFTDPDRNAIIGVNDEAVYYKGSGFQTRFAVNMITSNDGSQSSGLAAGLIRDRVDYVQFGDVQYQLDDLVRARGEGFQVLKQMAADFGVDKYGLDENGSMQLESCMGSDLTDDELREAYSEREDFEDYTVCVYYLHARMSGMGQSEYDKCREELKSAYGIDHSSLLDGTLAVMLYYGTDGYDLFYTVAVAAPGYYESCDDFKANLNNQARHDITKCHMMMDGSKPVGFVNQVFIRCDQDEAFGPADLNHTETSPGPADGGSAASSGGETGDAGQPDAGGQ
ncbi:MAG: hypothetical protein NC311_13630 [Muribaculaceae bacterium]|nr:hypothetical protein [Muribaculaceae bacterium]